MKKNNDLKKGDVIIECGIAHKVTMIKKQQNSEGEVEPFIFYSPIFINRQHQNTICSIPKSSIEKTNIRPPLSKHRIYQQLKSLTKTKKNKLSITPKEMDEAFKANDFEQISSVVKKLSLEEQKPDNSLSHTEKNLYEKGISYLSQEIAVVFDISLDKAKQRLNSRLSN